MIITYDHYKVEFNFAFGMLCTLEYSDIFHSNDVEHDEYIEDI